MASPNHASVSLEDWKGKISTGFGLAHAAPPSAAHRAHPTSSPSIGPCVRWTRRPVCPAIGLPPFPPPREPRESGTDPAHCDLRHQRHGDQPHQPGPQIRRNPGAPPVDREGFLGVAQRTASGQLAHLSQESLVRAKLSVLLRVRYDGAHDLRAEVLLLPTGRQARQVHALIPRSEGPPVSPGRDLLELHDRLPLVGIDYAELTVQEVDEVALR